jgi:hypothetical protein
VAFKTEASRRIAIVATLSIAFAILIAGCTFERDGASETPIPSALPTADPAPTTDPADPSTWTIGFDGIGPAKLGSPLADLHTSMPTLTDETPDLCKPGQVALTDSNGLWLIAHGFYQAEDTVANLFLGSSDDAPVDGSPRTAAGIGIGSTESDLLAAYPGIPVTGTYSNATYHGVQNDRGTWIVFSIIDERVDAITVGPRSTMPKEFCPA